MTLVLNREKLLRRPDQANLNGFQAPRMAGSAAKATLSEVANVADILKVTKVFDAEHAPGVG